VPKKEFGQHFLTDPRILRRIVDFAQVGAADTVVEIGPGQGTLTRELAGRVGRVVAVEVDRDLIEPLRKTMPANVEVLEGDALELDFRTLAAAPYAIVANLPYNIATPLLDRFVRARLHISGVTVMLQKEVADRILAPPGTKAYGPLTVGIRHYAIVRSGFVVRPGAFRPPPRVHSRIVRLEWRENVPDAPDFIAFVGRSFSSRRKKLINNLASMFPARHRRDLEASLEDVGLSPDVRPENLTPGQFFALWQSLEGGAR